MDENSMPLKGVKVLDIGTMMSAPWAAAFLGDFGAEVIKVEHPKKADNARHFGAAKDGKGVFWKTLSRNKKCITLNINTPEGSEIFLQLVERHDVLIENFRPGTMEKWGFGWERLSSINPGLIWLRCSGFGQEGPYAKKGGFGTVAEAMSGFASINGYPDSPPTVPPIALADGIAGMAGMGTILTALYERDARGSGKGQVIDMTLYEPIMRLMEVQLVEYDVLKKLPQRLGSRIASTAPRNIYQTKEGSWLALSAGNQSVVEKLFKAIGREDLITDPLFADSASRIKNVDKLDEIVGGWIKQHTREEALRIITEAGAVAGPVYEMDQVFKDEHFLTRPSFAEVEDKDFGAMRLPAPLARLSRTPGKIRFTGRDWGEDNNEIYCGLLGISEEDLAGLQEKGII